jgi:hypothetical protein
MALVSPGVEVTTVDESNYLPAATSSVPYILVATAANKASGTDSTVIAPGTTSANANKVYLVTSQRDLAATFGNPTFYNTASGTPLNGYELNEYGLLAGFSSLGVSNRAYVQRANIDLAQLTATTVRPVGAPANGTYWLDTGASLWGLKQWNAATSTFTDKTPIVITSATQLSGGVPASSIGAQGDYAVVATNAKNPIYYKNTSNAWVLVGSDAWKNSWPTLVASNAVTGTLTAADVIIINGTSVAVPAAANNTLTGLKDAINSAAITGVTATIDTSNKLTFFVDSDAQSDGSSADGGIINIGTGSTAGLLTTLGLEAGETHNSPALQQSYNYTIPRWRTTDSSPRPSGSIWNMLSAVNNGADLSVKKYNSTTAAFTAQDVPLYANDQSALKALDATNGGSAITVGSLYGQYNVDPEANAISLYNNTATFKVYERYATGALNVTGDNTASVFVAAEEFTIQASAKNSDTLSSAVTAVLGGTTSADFVAAVSAAGVANVSASVSATGAIVMTHDEGGVIVLKDTTGTPVADAGFATTITTGQVKAGTGTDTGALILSNWIALTYTASANAPSLDPTTGTNWYYSPVDEVDIMIQSGGAWKGYQTVSLDTRGMNLTNTSPNGPIVSANAPSQQSDKTDLVYGDIWIDTSNLEEYPVIKRYSSVNNVDTWVTISNIDQTTENGILFADARWAGNGNVDPITDDIPTVKSLLTNSYTDVDAPNPALYPEGMLLFNTRRSGYNVKTYQTNYFIPTSYTFATYASTTAYVSGDRVTYNGGIYVAIASTTGNVPTDTSYWALLQQAAWVTTAGNKSDGSPYMGRLAVRQLVVAAMKSAIDTSDTLREEQLDFNLYATPNYPELISNMVALNNERDNTGFVIGDTPMRMAPTSADILAWSGNTTAWNTGDGLTTASEFMGVFYPSGQTNNVDGKIVVVPPSHMMLRTVIRSDDISFPWLAPAGSRRGLIDNALAIGYINASTGEFTKFSNGQGIRDTLYENKINPITFIPGAGLQNYGNKTEAAASSAMDRINVARLVAYIRGRLDSIASTFLFEPNDQITRNEISNAISGLLNDLVAKRGIYDYLVVCDLSNNTPARIDRNELYVDIAIEPTKAVEFIYIPVRIKNTGELAAGNVATSQTV